MLRPSAAALAVLTLAACNGSAELPAEATYGASPTLTAPDPNGPIPTINPAKAVGWPAGGSNSDDAASEGIPGGPYGWDDEVYSRDPSGDGSGSGSEDLRPSAAAPGGRDCGRGLHRPRYRRYHRHWPTGTRLRTEQKEEGQSREAVPVSAQAQYTPPGPRPPAAPTDCCASAAAAGEAARLVSWQPVTDKPFCLYSLHPPCVSVAVLLPTAANCR